MKSNKFYLFTTNILKLLCGEKNICRGSATPTLQGAGLQSPPKFRDPYVCPNGLTYNHEIWYGNTRWHERVSKGVLVAVW